MANLSELFITTLSSQIQFVDARPQRLTAQEIQDSGVGTSRYALTVSHSTLQIFISIQH